MTTLLKSVLIFDSTSNFYKKKVDLRIYDGCLQAIAESLPAKANDEVIEGKDLAFIPGLTDLRVHSTLPGGEQKENWQSLTSAARSGGIRAIQLLPTGNPVPQTVEHIKFIASQGKQYGMEIIPLAPLTIDNKGENFTDLIDLFQGGARGFSHGDGSLQNTDLFLKCLQYLMTQPVIVYTQPDTSGLSLFGQIHEGLQSTLTGLKGIPTLSETLAIKRDIDLLEYVMSHSFGNLNENFGLHFYCISAEESVELIRAAKAKKLPITCSVAAHQLIFDESTVETFDTNTKVFPPYRTKEDRLALIQGVLDGVIDAIVSDHHAIEIEAKEVEFDHASFGIIGLQTLLQASLEAFKSKDLPKIIKALVDTPNSLIGLKPQSLTLHERVCGSIVDLQQKSTFTLQQIKSLSKNTGFLNYTFKSSIINVYPS